MSEKFNITGMGKACLDPKYVEFVKNTVKKDMNGQKSINLETAISIFQQYNKNLDENDINKIKTIAMKDNNESVNEREMATIYALLDAELGDDNRFHIDGKINGEKVKFGLQEAYDKEIDALYTTFKTKEDIEAEEKQELEIKNAAIAKTKEIVGEYSEINMEKYSQMKLAAEIPLEDNFNAFKNELSKRGIEFTELDKDTVTYKLGDKTCITKNTQYMCMTTIKDSDGNVVQTIRSSGIRDNTNGILVTNFNDGKKQNSISYSSSDHECLGVTEYYYGEDGKLEQEVSQQSHYTFVTKHQENGMIKYRMRDGILFYENNNGKITKYSEQDLANMSE